MLSQCVQYHNASKFTAGFQHFPFIVLYRYGDTHWSWQIILFIIEHYSMHSIIRFISCPACLRRGIWTDIRVDIKERILPDTWCDNIHEEHFIWEGDGIYVCCAWEKNTWPSLGDTDWQVLTEMLELIGKLSLAFDLAGRHRAGSFAYSNSGSLRYKGDKTAAVLFNSCKNVENCKINPQLMNFKELIEPLSEVGICLSSAQ